jgi:hypothetical protein
MGANNKGNSPNAMSPIFTNFAAKLRMLSQTPSTNPLRNLWGVGALLLTIIVFSLVGLGLSQLMGKILYGLTPEQTSQLLNHPSRTAIGINVLLLIHSMQANTSIAKNQWFKKLNKVME